MQIGCFRRTGDGFTGRLQTVAIDVPLRLAPVADRGNETAPDWCIHLDDEPDGPAVGSGWTHQRDGRPGFVAVQIDCPSLARPLRALCGHRLAIKTASCCSGRVRGRGDPMTALPLRPAIPCVALP